MSRMLIYEDQTVFCFTENVAVVQLTNYVQGPEYAPWFLFLLLC